MSSLEDNRNTRLALAIKDRREQLGLTLRALADRSGVSASMISDIERGSKSPTISTLYAISDALELPASSLVDASGPPASRIRVVRAADRPSRTDAAGVTRETLAPPMAGGRIEFMRCVVPAFATAGPFPAHARGTIEHILLTEGKVRVVLGPESVDLDAGDLCTCLADQVHCFDNSRNDRDAELYLIVEPA